MVQQLYWTLCGSSSTQKKGMRSKPKDYNLSQNRLVMKKQLRPIEMVHDQATDSWEISPSRPVSDRQGHLADGHF